MGTLTFEEADEDDRMCYIGDAIIKVNQTKVSGMTHDEALSVLRNAGPVVTLVVKHVQSATSYLLKKVKDQIPEQEEQEEDVGTPGSVLSDASSIGSVDAPVMRARSGSWNGIPAVKRKWVDVVEVPLMMAYITRYIFGTDKIRSNSFEVIGIDGSKTGRITSSDLATHSHWIKLITDYIHAMTSRKGSQLNRLFSGTEQITHMGWVAEGILNRNQPWQNWHPKFFVLKGADVLIFEKPPTNIDDWMVDSGDCCSSHKIYECMLRLTKESEHVDERQNCFVLQTADCPDSRYFSLETKAELMKLHNAWHRSVCYTISQMGCKEFHVVYRNQPAAFTIDWIDGFMLKTFTRVEFTFVYNFSQLRNSFDDGASTLTLQFVEDYDEFGGDIIPPRLVDQVLICPKLQQLLFFMHAFLTAKVASLDPAFVTSSNSRKS